MGDGNILSFINAHIDISQNVGEEGEGPALLVPNHLASLALK